MERRALLHGQRPPARQWREEDPIVTLRRIAPQMFSADLQWFHEAFWRWVFSIRPGVRPDPLGYFVFRGAGKSSMAEMVPILLGGMRVRRYCVYLSNSQDLADDHLTSMSAILESSLLAVEFPELGDRKFGKFGNSKGWRRNRLWTSGGLIIDALGLDVAARGRRIEEARPDIIVADDVDDQNDSLDVTLKKLHTFTKKILPMGAPDAAVLFVQNLISEHSLASRVAKPENFAIGERLLSNAKVIGPIPAIEDMATEEYTDDRGRRRHRIVAGEPNWPERLPIPVLQQLLDESNLHDFEAEYQHATEPPEGGLFGHVRWNYVPWDEVPWAEMVQTEVWVDPSVTAKDSSDSMGICAMSVGQAGKLYALWSVEKIMTVTEAMKAALVLAERVRAAVVGVETNQGGDLWLTSFRRELEDMEKAGLVNRRWSRVLKFREAKAGAYESKVERASRLVPEFDHGNFLIAMDPGRTYLTLQRALRRFPKSKPLDLVDSASWAVASLRKLIPAPDMVTALKLGEPLRERRWVGPENPVVNGREPGGTQGIWAPPGSAGGNGSGGWSI